MDIEDQSLAIAFLTNPGTHGEPGSAVTTIQTHISIIFLAGERVFKLKRAVRLPYVDFSTKEARHSACIKEVELNRRTAPALYRGVRRITAETDGSLAFDGTGPLVDAVVEMVRFEQQTLFDRMAEGGLLTPTILTKTARMIADFHATAAINRRQSGSSIMANVLSLNEQAFAPTHLFADDAVAALNGMFRAALGRCANLLDARAAAGRVRHCHGDLHLRNICLLNGAPTLFDCIEFDDEIATIDVLYDLAFLVMDLWHRSKHSDANLILNRYLDAADESDGLPLIPFFMAVRSAIRAHVTAVQSEDAAPAENQPLKLRAKSYFELPRELLAAVPARLVAIGGLSGTGKSSLASGIAGDIGPPPGARVLSSDRIRKKLHGVSAETRLPVDAYRSEISERVYAIQAAAATTVLLAGHSVITDAVFDRVADRKRIEACAEDAGVPFSGVWLEAGTDILLKRVGARQGDPSDATEDVVRLQAAQPQTQIGWSRVSTAEESANVVAQVLDALKLGRPAS